MQIIDKIKKKVTDKASEVMTDNVRAEVAKAAKDLVPVAAGLGLVAVGIIAFRNLGGKAVAAPLKPLASSVSVTTNNIFMDPKAIPAEALMKILNLH